MLAGMTVVGGGVTPFFCIATVLVAADRSASSRHRPSAWDWVCPDGIAREWRAYRRLKMVDLTGAL
jgi:hypothetical protein